jgi:hypothetical protein
MNDWARKALLVLGAAAALCCSPILRASASGQDPSLAEVLERLRRLETEQKETRETLKATRDLLKAKDARLNQLEEELKRVKESQAAVPAPRATPAVVAAPAPLAPAEAAAEKAPPTGGPAEQGMLQRVLGTYRGPGSGFVLVETKQGEVAFSAYTYVRYLNQKGLDKHYTNGFGDTVTVDRRQDVQLNKVKLDFRGWLLDPRLRWNLWTWTSNTAMGQGAQVVIAGNLQFVFDKAFSLGGGVWPLPTVRSLEGSWPYFLAVDRRTMVDEFFRGSYTEGFFALGEPLPGVRYTVMLGNNLSILGVDAGQLDAKFSTVSGALWWMPTTGEYGPPRGAFGDFEDHQDVATRIGAHFTFSPEDTQEQPGTESIDNTQIRLSNATNIFTPNALGPGITVKDLHYYMTSFDTGMKYRGFSFEGEYFLRWLNDFSTIQPAPQPRNQVFDHGFQLQTSMMLLPQSLQVYAQGSYLFGDFGDPWELSGGLNWWPFKRREIRFNLDYLYDRRSVVGYSAIPQSLGATGSIFNANLEFFF